MKTLKTVLVANRSEIAVRVVRACRDHGLRSVAVYAEPDRTALHVRLADEAVDLGGDTAATTYLSSAALLSAVEQSGADAVHPGYGFLSEDADFAQAVVDAGLTWIGPPPEAIRALGNKVTARQIARDVGAPLVPGTDGPVADADEVLAFADQYGLPIAIKAIHGGGGRGMKVARTLDEIPELFDSAVREATAAFGRGSCFVERYVDRPRHVEVQVLADAHGTVVIVGTRDCSLQRRYQKLVEEAPAPFLSGQQRTALHDAARAICRAAGYQGAGTVEFLVGADGLLTFLEVNTRLQVEHPVSEETTGLDLVVEQFRIAAGERLRVNEDPEPRGHSFQFRINGEDAGRGFLPAPGTITALRLPTGPGVRVDSGVEVGTVVGGQFDSLLAKLIVTGADRPQALARARRALAECDIQGLATVLPFHRAVVEDAAFTADTAAGFSVHTRWIETEWTATVPPHEEAPTATETTVVVGGRALAVQLPAGVDFGRRGPQRGIPAADTEHVLAPMQGSITRVAVGEGDVVRTGDLIVVLEAMKMENPVLAHRDGTVTGLTAASGDSIAHRAVICAIA